MVKPGLDFFALVFGLFKAGVAPVLIDPGMGVASLGGCRARRRRNFFSGSRAPFWRGAFWAGGGLPCGG